MQLSLVVSFFALVAALPGPNVAHAQSKGQSPAEYRVGDRLAKDKAASQAYRQIEWDDLIPKGWDPMAAFKGLDLARLKDNDPKAQEALEKMRSAWDQAPVETALNGQRVRPRKTRHRNAHHGCNVGQWHAQTRSFRNRHGRFWLPSARRSSRPVHPAEDLSG
jgi:hypothetical protein